MVASSITENHAAAVHLIGYTRTVVGMQKAQKILAEFNLAVLALTTKQPNLIPRQCF